MIRMFQIAVVLLIALVMPAFAGWETQTVGANGYDLVAYQKDNKAVRGETIYMAYHNDTVYLFASEANQKLFTDNPERYLPAYGGYCAYGMSNGYKVPVDPEAFTVIDGRLYLNFNEEVMTEWRKEIPERVKRADESWTKIKDQAPVQ